MPFEGCCVAASNIKHLWLRLYNGLNSILYMDAVMCSFKTGNNGTPSDANAWKASSEFLKFLILYSGSCFRGAHPSQLCFTPIILCNLDWPFAG